MEKFGFRETVSGLKKPFYTNERNSKLTEDVLVDGNVSINGEGITPIDMFYIPEDLDDEKKLDIIAKNLQMERSDLEKKLPVISRYWQEAKEFYKTFLIPENESKAILPREIENLESFSNVRELIKTLEKATIMKKDGRMGLGPSYCALFSLMTAESEYDKKEFEGLLKESEYAAEKLFKKGQDGVAHFHLVNQEDDEWSRVGIMVGENSWINAKLSFRGKTKNSTICKLAYKPEFSVEERIKDGIGLKLEVSGKEEAEKVFPFLSQFLKDNFGADKIIFENVGIFGNDEYGVLKEELKDIGVGAMPNEDNRSSHKNFKTAKIRGEMKVPQNGEEGRMEVRRNFEVQVVLTDNKNETGLAQNKIYKRIQKLSLFSRLFGSFDEDYLNLICEEASQASGMSKEKIKKYIIGNFLQKLISRSKNIKYVSKEQLERWQGAGVMPPEIKIAQKKP